MNKQHEHAVQRAKDLEDLKTQELEYQRYQQMLAQQKDKFNDIKKNLELTASPSARSVSTKKESVKSPKSSKSSSKKQKEPSDTMSEMSTSTNATNTTNATSQSGVSQISINNNLAKRLNNQISNKSRKSNDISIDQISFGSNKKK
jgi:hypothetical protein